MDKQVPIYFVPGGGGRIRCQLCCRRSDPFARGINLCVEFQRMLISCGHDPAAYYSLKPEGPLVGHLEVPDE